MLLSVLPIRVDKTNIYYKLISVAAQQLNTTLPAGYECLQENTVGEEAPGVAIKQPQS